MSYRSWWSSITTGSSLVGFRLQNSELINVLSIVMIVTLPEWRAHALGLLFSSCLIICFFFQIIFITEESNGVIISFDLRFSLTCIAWNEFNIFSELFQRHTVRSSVQNSLSCFLLLSVIKYFWWRQRTSSFIIVVKLLPSGSPREIIVRRLGHASVVHRSNFITDRLFISSSLAISVDDILIHHLKLCLFVLSQHWEVPLINIQTI